MTPRRALLPLLRPIAQRALSPDIPSDETDALLDEAFGRYEAERFSLDHQGSAGGWLMVHLAALTAGLYHALMGHGYHETEARRLTARVTWAAYEKMAVAPTLLSSVGATDTLDHIRRATDLFRHFPFSSPSYVMRDRDAGPEVVAFDVLKCPVAEYFQTRDLSRLCVESWCNLDFPLAEHWGGQLDRTTTLAEGAERCDFRWRSAGPEREGATLEGGIHDNHPPRMAGLATSTQRYKQYLYQHFRVKHTDWRARYKTRLENKELHHQAADKPKVADHRES